MAHAVDGPNSDLYVHHQSHPLVAPLGESVRTGGVFDGSHLGIDLREGGLGFADALGEGVPLLAAALHSAGIEFAIEFGEGAFEFVGALLSKFFRARDMVCARLSVRFISRSIFCISLE